MPRSRAGANTYDSWAILAWLQGEDAGSHVNSLLSDASRRDAPGTWSVINAGEVYYQLVRRRGREIADDFWRDATKGVFPLRMLAATEARVRRAAAIKAACPVAYADAFAMATALEMRQQLVTGDEEIRAASGAVGVNVLWLR